MISLLISCALTPSSLVSEDDISSWPAAAPPSFTLEEYVEQLNQSFSFGLPDADEARQRYLEWRSFGDSFCPGTGFQLQGIIEPCTASSGYTFSGMAGLMGSTTHIAFPDSFEVGADCYILSPSNERFVGAGDLTYLSTGDSANGEVISTIRGTWESPTDSDWMGTDNSIWLNQQTSWIDQDRWSLTYQGGYHLNDIAVQFEAFSIGADCQGGTGTISIRDPNGYWVRLDFSDDCSGCGEATYTETTLGDVCLDLFSIFELEYEQQSPF